MILCELSAKEACVRPCNGGGKCCEKYGHSLQASQRDVDRWSPDRPDILRYMDRPLGDLWLNPQTGEEVQRCPWLRKVPREQRFKCRIYELRPDVCRDYPVSVQQMIDDGCEMLESADIGKSVEVLTRESETLRTMPP